MPARYQIFETANLVYVSYFDVVTTEESIENFLAYLMSGDARPGRSIFVDFTDCTRMDINFQDMAEMVAEKLGLMDPYDATMVTAMVAPDDAIYEHCLTYQRLVSGSDKQLAAVFRTRDEAAKFLQIDLETIGFASA